jgi:hypothetical protein
MSVIMAVDHVSDRLVETLFYLIVEPRRRFGVDRVSRDHALGRDQEHREVEVVLKPIEIACDLGDLALRFVLLGAHG